MEDNKICVERDNIIESGFLNNIESSRLETVVLFIVSSIGSFFAVPLFNIDYMNIIDKIMKFIF